MEIDSNTLLKVMSIFNFASNGFENHPLRNRKLYNHITEELNKVFYLDWKESTHYSYPSTLANRCGMPIYALDNQIVEQYVYEVEMENPMLVALREIPTNCINMSPMIPVMVLACRKQVKNLMKATDIFNDFIQSNMKTYFNLFYGSVDAKNSIIRSIDGFCFHHEISQRFLNMIEDLTLEIDQTDVLFYDTDTIYIRSCYGNGIILDDNIKRINSNRQLNVQVKKFDNLIVTSRKVVIRFNGEITTLVVGCGAELIGC